MTQPLIHRSSTAGEAYVRALTSVYRQWRVYDPSYALSRDFDAYEKVRRDAVIAHALQYRRHLVAGRSWQFQPASESKVDKEAAAVMRQLFQRIRRFTNARYNLANAVVRGQAFAAIEGDRSVERFGDGKFRRWWVPTKLVDIDKRRFHRHADWGTDPETNESMLNVHWRMFSIERTRWERLEHPEHFVKHTYDDEESSIGYGRGLIDALYFFWRMKELTLNEGMGGVERWAQGMVVGKLDGVRVSNRINTALVSDFLSVLEKHKGRHAMVFDKQDDVQVVNGPGQGHQIVMEMLEYLDTALRTLIIGSNVTTAANTGGSYALAEVQENATEELVTYDRDILSDTINHDLTKMVWNLNRAALADCGLGGAQMPRFKIISSKTEDPQKVAQTVSTLLNSGVPLKREEVYEKVGFTPPNDDDEIIEGPQQAPGGQGEGMPAPMGPEAGGGPDLAALMGGLG